MLPNVLFHTFDKLFHTFGELSVRADLFEKKATQQKIVFCSFHLLLFSVFHRFAANIVHWTIHDPATSLYADYGNHPFVTSSLLLLPGGTRQMAFPQIGNAQDVRRLFWNFNHRITDNVFVSHFYELYESELVITELY